MYKTACLIKEFLICSFKFKFIYQYNHDVEIDIFKDNIKKIGANIKNEENDCIICELDSQNIFGGIFPSRCYLKIKLVDSSLFYCELGFPALRKVAYAAMYSVILLVAVSMYVNDEYSKIGVVVFLHYMVHVSFYATIPLRIEKSKVFLDEMLNKNGVKD